MLPAKHSGIPSSPHSSMKINLAVTSKVKQTTDEDQHPGSEFWDADLGSLITLCDPKRYVQRKEEAIHHLMM